MNLNVCSGGVDLNRNFIHDWVFVPECKGPFGTSHGASAGSEKETQVMRAFMESNKPTGNRKTVYINTHYGGGPWIHYNGNNEARYYIPLRSVLIDRWSKKDIQLKNITIENFLPPSGAKASPGGAASDAAAFNYESFTVEVLARSCVNGHKFGPIDAPCGERKGGANHPAYELVQTGLYPIFEQFFLSVSESATR